MGAVWENNVEDEDTNPMEHIEEIRKREPLRTYAGSLMIKGGEQAEVHVAHEAYTLKVWKLEKDDPLGGVNILELPIPEGMERVVELLYTRMIKDLMAAHPHLKGYYLEFQREHGEEINKENYIYVMSEMFSIVARVVSSLRGEE